MEEDTISVQVLPTSGSKHIVTIIQDGKALDSDQVNLADRKKRNECIDAFCTKFPAIEFETLEAELLSHVNVGDKSEENTESVSSDELLSKMPQHVRHEARDILENGNLIEQAYNDASACGIVGEHITVATLYLTGVSRLLPRPMAVIVQGSSSSGKSYSVETVAELFPRETKLVAHQMTSQSLFHLPPGSLKNKFVVAGERSRLENDDRAESTRALREMISSGVLRKLMPEKEGGKIVTQCIEQEGPIAFVESTTLGEIFDEDLNRCILIHTDETEEQTRRILEAAARGKSRQSEQAIERQHAIQYMLKPHDVVIPYAADLVDHIPADKVEARRAFPMLLTVIRASALLHQYQRQLNADGAIIATESDYATAYAVSAKPMAEQIGKGVSDAATAFWYWIKASFGDDEFCRQDLLNRDDCPKKRDRVYSLVAELDRSNCLMTVGVKDRHKYYAVNNSPDESTTCIPSLEILFPVSRRNVGMSIENDVTQEPIDILEFDPQIGTNRNVGTKHS